MIKRILMISATAFLTACGGGGGGTGGETPVTQTPVENPGDNTSGNNTSGDNTSGNNTSGDNTSGDNTSGNNTPVDNTPAARAGAYIGDFGSGEGVYVLGADNALSGLALAADGSANSLFGNLGAGSAFSGELRAHFHAASTPANEGIFSAGELVASGPVQFNLNIVDGQTIESLSGNAAALTAVGAGGISPATPATVAGDWSGSHQFCGADLTDCSNLVTEITFSGSTVNGRTVIIDPNGLEQFPNAIAGSITQLGDVSTLTYTWFGNTYVGSIFFLPGSDSQLVFLGETQAADAGNKTISSLLTR